MNVLFISDGSLSNPILHSQGIPHIIENSEKGVKFFVLAFEEVPIPSSSRKWYDEAREVLDGKAKIISVELKSGGFPSQIKAFMFLFLGIVKGIQIVKNYKIDIIHGRSNKPSLIALVLKILFKKKVLFDNRGLVSDEIDRKKVIRIKIEKIIEKILLKYSDAIVVVSKVFKDYIISNIDHKKISGSNIFVIRNSFSAKRFKFLPEIRDQQRKQYNLSDKLVMVYSGPSIGWQRFDVVLEVFKKLKQLHANSFFLVISYDPVIKQMTENAGISKSDFAVFNLQAGEVNKFLLMGDFGIILSDKAPRRLVSAPIKFGEYLASGLPVLLMTKIGDTEEIVRKYGVGVLVENEIELLTDGLEKIITLSNKPGIKEKCRFAAETELSLSLAANQYFEIYESLKNEST
jgi:glycosyltransferase involved in cell wall biosynthesis